MIDMAVCWEERVIAVAIARVHKGRSPEQKGVANYSKSTFTTSIPMKAVKQLAQNAPDRPNIKCIRVVLPRQHYLWRTVPSGRHIACCCPRCSLGTGEPKVAYAHVQALIYEDVLRLEVSMKNLGGV